MLTAARIVGHARIDDSGGVSRLLEALRKAEAGEAVAAFLARDPAAHASLEDPFDVASLLDALSSVGADDAVATLAYRAARFVSLDNPRGVASLLGALRKAEAMEAVSALGGRAADAGMFSLHLRVNPGETQRYHFGREPSGEPCKPWNWQAAAYQELPVSAIDKSSSSHRI